MSNRSSWNHAQKSEVQSDRRVVDTVAIAVALAILVVSLRLYRLIFFGGNRREAS